MGQTASFLGPSRRALLISPSPRCWERFSYYGMSCAARAVHGQAAADCRVMPNMFCGLGGLRHLFELRGPMSDVAFASLIYGWYSGLVYFTPVLGGIDRRPLAWDAHNGGARRPADERWAPCDVVRPEFSARPAMLIVGSGCLKGNISAQVGQLYPRDEETNRTAGFTIFSAAINIGAVLGPLGCGGVAAVYGWHAGFALAAALMLLALVIYLIGPTPRAGKASGDSGRWRGPAAANVARASPGRALGRRGRAHGSAERRLSDDLEYRAAVD